MATEIEKLKEEFFQYLEIEKGASLKTRENYERYLKRFFDFSKVKKASEITDERVRIFRVWLNRQPNAPWKNKDAANQVRTMEDGDKTLSKKTQNYYLIALRVFLKYLTKRGIKSMAADQIELAKVAARQLELITSEELARIMDTPKGNGIKAVRDRAILELLFSTGLRVSELCALSRDINLRSPELSVRGKGGKVRVVFISDSAKSAIEKYLSLRKDMEDALFVRVPQESKEGKKIKQNTKREIRVKSNLNRHSIERMVREYATIAGISKKVTPHTMRHMFATDLLSNGADLRSVQALLGHSSIMTTQIYTHVTDKQLLEVHKKFHSKGNK
jgi:site-specific recombinase XerD